MDKIYKNVIESKYNTNKVKKIYFMETTGQMYTILSNSVGWLIETEYERDEDFKQFVMKNGYTLDKPGWEVASILLSMKTSQIQDDRFSELVKITNQIPDLIFMSKLLNDKVIDIEKIYSEIQKVTKKVKFEIFAEYARLLLDDVNYFEFIRMLVWQITDLIKLTYTKYNTFYYDGVKYNNIDIYDIVKGDKLYNWRDVSIAITCSDITRAFRSGNTYDRAFTGGLIRKISKECDLEPLTRMVVVIDGADVDVDEHFVAARGNNAVNMSDNTKSYYITEDIYNIIKDKKLFTNSSIFMDLLMSVRTIFMTRKICEIDMRRRTKLFRLPTNIKLKLEHDLDMEFTIYEYIQDDKLNIFAHIECEYFSNYYIIRESDISGLFNQTIGSTEVLGLLILLSILGFGEEVKKYCDFTVELTKLTYKLNNGQTLQELITKRNMIFDEIDNITKENKETIVNTREYRDKSWNEISLRKIQPFIRRLPVGQTMSEDARELENKLKIEVPKGYTVVTEHYRNIKHK